MKIKTIIVFVVLFSVAMGLNLLSRFKNFTASSGPIGNGTYEINEKVGIYHRQKFFVPEYAFADNIDTKVLGEVSGEKWIEVDLTEQKLTAWQGGAKYLESLVSTGLPWFPTPTGEFRIWIKLRSTRMEGGQGAYYYNLPNVPYTMFIENDRVPGWRGFGLHGTYWHNDFGRVHSHGCINLPTPIAEKLYYWVGPNLGENIYSIRATENNPGTKIVIHQ